MKCLEKNGQALVEFVIILPIFIFMILAVIDIGKILTTGVNLESRMEDVVTSYKDNQNTESISNNLNLKDENITLEVTRKENNRLEFKLTKEMDIITPGLNLILGNPFKAKTTRVVYHE